MYLFMIYYYFHDIIKTVGDVQQKNLTDDMLTDIRGFTVLKFRETVDNFFSNAILRKTSIKIYCLYISPFSNCQ